MRKTLDVNHGLTLDVNPWPLHTCTHKHMYPDTNLNIWRYKWRLAFEAAS